MQDNVFLTGPLGRVFARTAAPIILITVVSGLYVVIDAAFLGHYAGADALAAVTLIFPAMMLMVALQSLVASGMASLVARRLGAGDRAGAGTIFASAHRLALVVALCLWAGALVFAPGLIAGAAGNPVIAAHARTFLAIIIGFSPVAFALSLQIDALRCEGRLGFMALVMIASSLLNVAANWLLMAVFSLGVAGSAWGTVLAQAICLSAILLYRRRNRSALGFAPGRFTDHWRDMLVLGAPSSLGFIGISLNSAAILFNLSLHATPRHEATVAAYGIVTRVLTLAYLPMMGVSAALQTIAGNNFGAGLKERVGRSLLIALASVLVYCTLVEVVILSLAGHLGGWFVADPLVMAETARILPSMVVVYFLVGQVVMLSGYFQALGNARLAAVFGLARPYLFSIPLAFLLPFAMGEPGIWLVAATADLAMLALAAVLLRRHAARTGWHFGVLPA